MQLYCITYHTTDVHKRMLSSNRIVVYNMWVTKNSRLRWLGHDNIMMMSIWSSCIIKETDEVERGDRTPKDDLV